MVGAIGRLEDELISGEYSSPTGVSSGAWRGSRRTESGEGWVGQITPGGVGIPRYLWVIDDLYRHRVLMYLQVFFSHECCLWRW